MPRIWLGEPKLIDLDRYFRVKLYRRHRNGDTNSGTISTIGTNQKTEIEEKQILAIIKTNQKTKQKDIQVQMKISIRLVKRIRAGLQDKDAIIGMQGIIDLVNGSLNDVKTNK